MINKYNDYSRSLLYFPLETDFHGVIHQGAALWAKPIQSAQAELAASAKPASRTPQLPAPCPTRLPFKRNHNQGPAIMEILVPSANSAMTPAPSTVLPVNVATNKAE
jgi:hypothetical protein